MSSDDEKPKPSRTWNLPLPDGGTLPIEIVSEEEAEKAEAVVCNTTDIPSMLPQSRLAYGNCAWCGKAIYWSRITAPKKPPKVCIHCMIAKGTTH